MDSFYDSVRPYRRDSEGQTSSYRKAILSRLNSVDLQGLLMGEGGEFTQALEAFNIEYDGFNRPLSQFLSPEEAYVKAKLAQQIGIPFSILSRKSGPQPLIQLCRLGIGAHPLEITETVNDTLSEESFIRWWRRNKKTDQTKTFYERYIADSYFDNLLENNELAWGGNVDGILYDCSLDRIYAILEIRTNSRINHLKDYNPANYYAGTKGKPIGDYNTWQPLIKLARMLKVPLILMTFHKDYSGKRNHFGIASIKGQTIDELVYYDQRPPGSNLVSSVDYCIEYIGAQVPPAEEAGRFERNE